MKQPIKKLPKEILEEGITVELVNKINLKTSFTPVQIEKGDEPVNLMQCSTGFWISVDGEVLKDKAGKYIVVDEKTACIGRARYLVNYGEEEKEKKIKDLMDEWKERVNERLGMIGKKLKEEEDLSEQGFDHIIMRALASSNPEWHEKRIQQAKEHVERVKPLYDKAMEAVKNDDYIELIEGFNIYQFKNPMMSAKFDDEDAMRVVTNVFGAKAINQHGLEQLRTYAAIEINKQYPI